MDVRQAPSPPATTPGRQLLECRDLHFAFNGQPVLVGSSLEVRAGEVVALTGASGAGKTTLLRLVAGLLRPEQGDVRVEGRSVADRSTSDICRRVGYLPQDPNALLFADTVRDELDTTLSNHGLATGNGLSTALLDTLGISDLADRYPRDLSTGQRQRVALGAVAVTDPPLLLLDEPTRGLDSAAIARLAELLHDRVRAGHGVLIATHDRRLTRAAHRTIRLANGRIVPDRL
jgi:energy-coupling factor transport system ATP-binding protein